MIERILIVAVLSFLFGIGNGYMYYSNIAPKLDKIIEMLKEEGEEE